MQKIATKIKVNVIWTNFNYSQDGRDRLRDRYGRAHSHLKSATARLSRTCETPSGYPHVALNAADTIMHIMQVQTRIDKRDRGKTLHRRAECARHVAIMQHCLTHACGAKHLAAPRSPPNPARCSLQWAHAEAARSLLQSSAKA